MKLWRDQRGFTMIEIMTVLMIVAGLMGVGLKVFKSSFSKEHKEVSDHLRGRIKYFFNRASATGKTYRLVISMRSEDSIDGPQTITVEESEGKFLQGLDTVLLGGDDKKKSAQEKDGSEKSEAGVEDSESADAESADIVEAEDDDTPKAPQLDIESNLSTKFTKVTEGNQKARRKYTVPKKVIISALHYLDGTAPVTTGPAYIYAYPSGMIDHVAIVLQNPEDEEDIRVITTNPLNGLSEVSKELPSIEGDL